MKKTRIISVFTAVLMCMAFFVPMLSVNAKSADTSYKEWKQSDSRWGSLGIGNGGTMSSWGCKITAVAILMVHSGAEPMDTGQFNPGILRNRYVNKGYIAYTNDNNDGNLAAAALTKTASPDFYLSEKVNVIPTPFDNIYDCIEKKLAEGYYIEVRVNYNGHSVAVDYCSDGTIYIMDPGGSGKKTLNEYDGTIYYVNCYKANRKYSDTTPDYGIEYSLFDSEFYLQRYPELESKYGKNDAALYNYWITVGISKGHAASPFFDPVYYVNNNTDIKALYGDDYEAAYKHFLHYGCNEKGRKLSPVYDASFYAKHEDLKGFEAVDLLRDFIYTGIFTGKRASSEFDPEYYRSMNPELDRLYGDEYKYYFWHYLNKGISSGIDGSDYINEAVIGDIDGDGAVDSSDASMVLSAYVKTSTGGVSGFDKKQKYAADIDADGAIDSSDASMILSYYVYTATGGEGEIGDYISR